MTETLTPAGENARGIAKNRETVAHELATQHYQEALARALPKVGDEKTGLPSKDDPQKKCYVIPQVYTRQTAYRAGVLASLGDTTITAENTLKYIGNMTLSEIDKRYPNLGQETDRLPRKVAIFLEVTGIAATVPEEFERGLKTGEYILAGIQNEYGVSKDTPES